MRHDKRPRSLRRCKRVFTSTPLATCSALLAQDYYSLTLSYSQNLLVAIREVRTTIWLQIRLPNEACY